jgi:hypothetical protein
MMSIGYLFGYAFGGGQTKQALLVAGRVQAVVMVSLIHRKMVTPPNFKARVDLEMGPRLDRI